MRKGLVLARMQIIADRTAGERQETCRLLLHSWGGPYCSCSLARRVIRSW
jgi:hypothetical protein